MRLSHIFKIICDFISGDFVSIDKLYFFGPSHRSENGRFILKWSDYDPKSGIGGARKKGHGRYVLLDGGKIISQGKLERPNDGKVSNQGIFILNDWMFGEGLKGTFYAFDAKNKRLIRHKCDANLYNNGLSNDGQYAVCQTAYSDGEDGNMLFFSTCERKDSCGSVNLKQVGLKITASIQCNKCSTSCMIMVEATAIALTVIFWMRNGGKKNVLIS